MVHVRRDSSFISKVGVFTFDLEPRPGVTFDWRRANASRGVRVGRAGDELGYELRIFKEEISYGTP